MGAPSVSDDKSAEPMQSAERGVPVHAERDIPVHAERGRRQRLRSLAIAAALVLLVVLFYAATIVRLGGNVMNRAI